MTSLNDIFDQLRKVGEELEQVDFASLLPEGHEHHRSALFIRLPFPGVLDAVPEVAERIGKLLSSVNRPDTIKMDVYTIVGANVLAGWQPHTEATAAGHYEVEAILNHPYVLQVTVDIVQGQALEATYNALQK